MVLKNETRFDWENRSQHAYDYRGTDRIKGITSTKMNKSLTVFLMIDDATVIYSFKK